MTIPPASSINGAARVAIAIPPASSSVRARAIPPASSILAIERRRAQLGLSHAELCRRAEVDEEGWRALRAGGRQPARRTLERLERALEDAVRPPSPPAIASLFRAALALVARAQELEPAALLAVAVDFTTEKPKDPVWLAFARARRLAIYVVTVELEIPNADLARAIGCSRQNVKQARDRVEEWRDDPAVNSVIASVAQTMGRS